MSAVNNSLRVDKWLWFARFCKSRNLAQGWIEAGEVAINGAPVEKCHQPIKIGDKITLPRGMRARQTVEVLALAERRGPATEAQALYVTLTIEAVAP